MIIKKKFLSKVITIIIISLMIISCGRENALKKYHCKILSTERLFLQKKMINIQVPNELSKKELEEIATQLRSRYENFKKLFVFYYLPGMEVGSGAWATTNYTPSLSVNIIGLNNRIQKTEAPVNLSKKISSPKKVLLGKWHNNTPHASSIITIYKVDGKYSMTEVYIDGSSKNRSLEFSKSHGQSKFTYKNKFGEYFLIKYNGNLSLYDKQGLILTAEKE